MNGIDYEQSIGIENMKDWKEYKLGDLAEITSSKRIFYSDYVDKGIPFWRSKEVIEQFRKQPISTDLFITIEKYEEIKDKFGVPKKDDLLLTSVGTLGIPYLVKEGDRFYFKDGNLTWVRNIKNNILEPKYLYLWIGSLLGQEALSSIKIGSTQEALTIIGLKNLDLLLPPLPEQRAIAAILSSLDEKIDLLHRQNKTLEAMAETLFRQWFVEDNDGLLGSVSDLIQFNPTRSLPKGTVAPYLEMANVSTNVFHPENWYDREFSSGMKFINGDTLLARITPCLENGKSSYVTFLKDGQVGWGSTEFIIMRSKEKIHSLFTYALARNRDFRDYAEGCLEGSSGRQRVNIDHLVKFEINIPSDDVIQNFNALMKGIEPKLNNNFYQIRTLEKLRDTLLPKLMSGEVRVAV
ncbi:MAG: restriction endonuclease subunit S [Leptospiraceae bacterium]|nr:restriction endonuclease subunit S [Leptospiraceae bacterium]